MLNTHAGGHEQLLRYFYGQQLAFERDSHRHKLLAKLLPGEFEFHLCEICSSWIA